ncbi:MAG TPA: competence/damage-inducible protein A [Vicinamibacterales bacterium]|nr:competence/damage-inducible protein A [Vicinamibacterales bacterium]
MRAEIVAVGSEMLTPTHLDTNSLFITERLNELGIDLQGKAVAGDDRDVLKAIVADALRRSDLLILTGGLGPTDDDLTRDVVADLIGEPLEYHADIFERIEQRFTSRGLRTPAINRRQAMVPRGAAVLPNKNGTAPGLWIEHDRKLILLLPGPPRELKPMLEAVIQERLLGLVGASRLFRRVLRITGQSESSVEEKMQPLYAKWLASPTKIATTILASLGQIELHLTAVATSVDEGQRALDDAVTEVRAALGHDLFSTKGESMQEIVGALCRARGFRISAAESCTGGLVMARLTEVPGSSDYVDRGVVVYSNQSKTDLLGVPADLIEQHGAVSEPVAEAMARGMVKSAGTDLAVGVTGVAGPGGGTPEKPVGMVAVAAAWARQNAIETRVRTYKFVGGREMVRFQASQAALDMVRRWLTES